MEDIDYINKELGTFFDSCYDFNWDNISKDPFLPFSDGFIERYKDKINWIFVSKYKCLSTNFIKKYENLLCMPLICTYQKLNDELIEKYFLIYLNSILVCQKLSVDMIEKLIDKYNSLIDWRLISNYQVLSEEFIEKYQNKVDWYCISHHQKLSEGFIEKYQNKVDWGYISFYQTLSENFIEKYKDKINWNNAFQTQKLSESFIEKYKDKTNWGNISQYQTLSESFIEKYKDKVNWNYVCCFQKLSEEFIEKHQNDVNWEAISIHQKLSEQFIEKYFSKLSHTNVYAYQKLSEEFIEKLVKNYIDKSNEYEFWYYISIFQKLSDDFIFKNTKHVNLYGVLNYQKLNNRTLKALSLSYVNKRDLWQYKDEIFKKKMLTNLNKYECHEDYFIAYKAIRYDRYSLKNFQYQYLPNETYESTCDCTNNENSFGLNVGTYEFAKRYLGAVSGFVVKCKVYYKDIGRIVHDGEKVRCFKITVLE